MTEQRVISTKPKIGARPPSGGIAASEKPAADEAEKKPKGGKKKLLLVVGLVLVVLVAGAAYWFLLGPGAGKADAAEEVEPPPVAGEVLTVEAVSINLQGGHYLRLGLGLQLTEEVEEAPDTARALDLAIALFSGRTVAEVSDAATREALKAELAHQLAEAYEGEVMGLYFTDYVSQ